MTRVTTPLGPEILPGAREYQWVASIVDAVERRTGRRSSWDRRLFEEPTDAFARTFPAGPMAVSREHILRPVMHAYDAPGELTAQDRQRARLGVWVVVHEIDHQQAELGDDAAPDAVRQLGPEDMALSEGFAEVKAARLTGLVMQDIGMDKAIPGSVSAFHGSVYPGYRAGVDRVLTGLQKVTGLSPENVVSAVEQAPRLQRYNAMADLVIDTRLDGLVPEAHRSQIRLQLSRPLRDQLGALMQHESPNGDPVALDRLGREHADGALAELEHQVGVIEQHYRQYDADAPRMPMSWQDRSLVVRIEAYYGRSTADVENAHLRQFLDNGSRTGLGGGGTAAGAGGGAAGGAAAGGAAASAAAAAGPVGAWIAHRSGGRPFGKE